MSDAYQITLDAVAAEYKLDPARILGDTRTGLVAKARKELIWRLHEQDLPHVSIADMLDRSVSYVNAAIRYRVLRHGLKDERNPLVQAHDRQLEIVALMEQGFTLFEIAKKLGYTYGSLRTVLSRMRKRGTIPTPYLYRK